MPKLDLFTPRQQIISNERFLFSVGFIPGSIARDPGDYAAFQAGYFRLAFRRKAFFRYVEFCQIHSKIHTCFLHFLSQLTSVHIGSLIGGQYFQYFQYRHLCMALFFCIRFIAKAGLCERVAHLISDACHCSSIGHIGIMNNRPQG